ncbi:MAG: hypothetical protein K8H84_07320 [Sulfuricella denitrificans]|nr:hypothetical protein [Sulfuricella denitrificans]
MISIKVDTTGLDKTIAQISGMAKQVNYATAVALTSVAKKAQAAMPAAMERELDRPTPFTKGSIFVSPARKENLAAIVGFKDRAATYMAKQIAGGTVNPGKAGLRLPASVQLNQYGNIPKGLIGQLIAVAKKEGKGLTKRKSRLIKVSNKVELFYGDPADVGGHNFPPGIYKRLDLGNGRRQLIPIIIFPRVAAHYKPRFHFGAEVEKIVRREWDSEFNRALEYALRTAR